MSYASFQINLMNKVIHNASQWHIPPYFINAIIPIGDGWNKNWKMGSNGKGPKQTDLQKHISSINYKAILLPFIKVCERHNIFMPESDKIEWVTKPYYRLHKLEKEHDGKSMYLFSCWINKPHKPRYWSQSFKIIIP
jgi:hypothetical protein